MSRPTTTALRKIDGKLIKVKRTTKWHQKLSLKEIAHIVETTDNGTLAQFKRNREFHKTHAEEPCWTCRHIAVKLGFE